MVLGPRARRHAFVLHQPNSPSGGRLSHIELGEFLRSGKGPEQQALLRLIGTLVEIPPYAEPEPEVLDMVRNEAGDAD